MDYIDDLGIRAIRTDTAGRVSIACQIIRAAASGRRDVIASRAFDNCFECGDGAAVVSGILDAADRDSELHAALRRWPVTHYVPLADWMKTAGRVPGIENPA